MRTLTTLLFLLTCLHSFAQLQPAPSGQKPVMNFIRSTSNQHGSRTTACGTDTVLYAQAKATGLQGLTINTITSADKVAQWFEVPQQMMLHGFTFYAWQADGTNDTVTLTCKAVLAGTDSFPTGPTIATTTVKVDSAFSSGLLTVLEKRAVFPNPVLVDYPFALVIETVSPISVALVASDWDSADGGMEWLGMASIPGAGWLHGFDVNVGGVVFDADFAFAPYVSYDIDASFTADTNCFFGGAVVDFINTTMQPVLHSRFYNQYVFNDAEQLIYTWDYDDGSPLGLVYDTSHTFPAGADYDVKLNVNLVGWTSTCVASQTTRLNPSTTSGFTYAQSGLTVQFTNTSTNADSSYWSFGDGQTSTILNPSHTFPSENNYNVTLISFGDCQGDTIKTLISLCNALSSAFNFSATGLEVDFTVAAISGSASFVWDFGDGGSGAGISASHTYASSGTYTACLIATNSCESDTTCHTVTVAATGISNSTGTISFSIEPNPVNDYFSLNGIAMPAEVFLYDTKGMLIRKWETTHEFERLDVREISRGIYFLKIETTGRTGLTKVIVE